MPATFTPLEQQQISRILGNRLNVLHPTYDLSLTDAIGTAMHWQSLRSGETPAPFETLDDVLASLQENRPGQPSSPLKQLAELPDIRIGVTTYQLNPCRPSPEIEYQVLHKDDHGTSEFRLNKMWSGFLSFDRRAKSTVDAFLKSQPAAETAAHFAYMDAMREPKRAGSARNVQHLDLAKVCIELVEGVIAKPAFVETSDFDDQDQDEDQVHAEYM